MRSERDAEHCFQPNESPLEPQHHSDAKWMRFSKYLSEYFIWDDGHLFYLLVYAEQFRSNLFLVG